MSDDHLESQKQEFADHQAEVAGIPNGKAERFLDGENSPRNRQTNERRARDKAFQTQLDLLMMNPNFAKAYERVGEAIDSAQDKLNAAMEKLASRIEHLQDVITDMEERTAKLPDGSPVFQDANGDLMTADGRRLSAAEEAVLLNPENLLSYEQYKGTSDALSGARAKQDRLSDIQPKIDDARDRRDNAETPEALEAIEKDIQDIDSEIELMTSEKAAFNTASEPVPITLETELDIAPAVR